MKKTIVFALLITGLTLSQGAFAKGTEISLYSGYRTGGELKNESDGIDVGLGESNTFGITIGKDYGPEHMMEFHYSRQDTDLRDKSTFPSSQLLTVDAEYFHIGGSQIWSNRDYDSYFGAGLGIIHLSPSDVSGSSVSKFSMNLNGGIVFNLTENIGLRLGIIGYFSSIGSNETFCRNNNCLVVGSGFMHQYEANAGLRFRF